MLTFGVSKMTKIEVEAPLLDADEQRLNQMGYKQVGSTCPVYSWYAKYCDNMSEGGRRLETITGFFVGLSSNTDLQSIR